MAGIEPIGTPQMVAAATEARLARLEQLLERISATLTATTDELPASPAGGSRNSLPICGGDGNRAEDTAGLLLPPWPPEC
jgi:hypothetical protein